MKKLLSRNFAKPSNGIVGLLVSKRFAKKNRLHEMTAARLCNIGQDHKVLEVGFGPGIGLREAFNRVSGGSGTVHGIDISQRSFNLASKNMNREIVSGKVKLQVASVMSIPYDSSMFDSIFHCNCYFYWPDMDGAVKELHRVIKPDKLMVVTLFLPRMELLTKAGYMQYGNIDPKRYMNSLEANGFYDVEMTKITTENKKIDAILAKARK